MRRSPVDERLWAVDGDGPIADGVAGRRWSDPLSSWPDVRRRWVRSDSYTMRSPLGALLPTLPSGCPPIRRVVSTGDSPAGRAGPRAGRHPAVPRSSARRPCAPSDLRPVSPRSPLRPGLARQRVPRARAPCAGRRDCLRSGAVAPCLAAEPTDRQALVEVRRWRPSAGSDAPHASLQLQGAASGPPAELHRSRCVPARNAAHTGAKSAVAGPDVPSGGLREAPRRSVDTEMGTHRPARAASHQGRRAATQGVAPDRFTASARPEPSAARPSCGPQKRC